MAQDVIAHNFANTQPEYGKGVFFIMSGGAIKEGFRAMDDAGEHYLIEGKRVNQEESLLGWFNRPVVVEPEN